MALDIQIPSPDSTVDLSEKGRRDGRVISLDRRLFMQFMAFGDASETSPYVDALEKSGLSAVLYEDINDPHGLGFLTFTEKPDELLTRVRPILQMPPFADLRDKPEYTMLGRTYSIGYEEDLERALIKRPIGRVTDPSLVWAIWYPVRRSGSFVQLSAEEQRTILMEHGGVGRAYGKADLAYDIRLACHGLDRTDTAVVCGLLGAVRDVNSGKLTPEAARVVAAKQLAAMQAEPAPG